MMRGEIIGVTKVPTYEIAHLNIPFEHEDFIKQYFAISESYSHHALLESGRGGHYSIAGFKPEAIIFGKNGELNIKEKDTTFTFAGNPLERMKEWMDKHEVIADDNLPDFQGGALGYISYDYVRYIERLPEYAKDDLLVPDLYFLLFRELFVFDHIAKTLWIMILHEPENKQEAMKAAANWKGLWEKPLDIPPEKAEKQKRSAGLDFSMDGPKFMQAAEKIRDYIAQGDVFQVNLSVRQSAEITVPAVEVYKQLREFNPSPYMGYFHTPEFQLVSASPELLVKLKKDEVSTRPIAGTRSRGKNPDEDFKLASDLIQNEKERAEHVMLVDLERNDLGRVSQYGSVEVNEFMVIEKYSHVMHIVSNVRGKLAEDKSWFDVVNAVFPGGTITGAPKVRTMEIIDELEPVRRGPYTGSMGWIGFNQDMELNIIIRTMLVKEGTAHIQAGAGIVIDSEPAHEYKESLKKARALWKAKELAETEKGDLNDTHD